MSVPSYPRSLSRPLEIALVTAIIGLHWLLGIYAVVDKSPTQDEPLHIASGYSYWLFNDYRMQPENGNLPQRLASLPLRFMALEYVDVASDAWHRSQQFHVSADFFYERGNDALWMLFVARAMMLGLGVCMCLAVYLWARKLWGITGGLIALILAAFAIEFLAHGPLATSDTAFALTTLLFLAALWHFLHAPGLKSTVLLGLAAGLAALAKFSVAILLPVAVILFLLRLSDPKPLTLRLPGRDGPRVVRGLTAKWACLTTGAGLAVVLAWGLLWSFYGCRYSAFVVEPERAQFYRQPMDQLPPESALRSVFEQAHAWRILPEAYLHGALYAYVHSLERNAYFLGRKGQGGWRGYFPMAFLVKVPLPLLLLLCCGCMLWLLDAVRRFRDGGIPSVWAGLYRTSPLWVFVLLYWASAIQGNLNIGFRHMLPVFPPLFILLGGMAVSLRLHPRLLAAFLGVLLAGYAAAAVRIHPHYLAYFNILAGGPDQGHYFLVDSSLDWGQDIPGLAAWQQAHLSPKAADAMFLALFTSADRHYHGVRGVSMFGYGGKYGALELPALDGGYYAMSATLLMGPYFHVTEPWTSAHESYYSELMDTVGRVARIADGDPARLAKVMQAEPDTDWARLFTHAIHFRMEKLRYYLLRQEPVAKIGHSIFIYEVTCEDLEQAGLMPGIGFPRNFHLRAAFRPN